jgi:hypothetical protein
LFLTTSCFYVPLRQDFVSAPALNIRTDQPLSSMLAALAREVHALDPNLALYEMITLSSALFLRAEIEAGTPFRLLTGLRASL